MRIVLATHDSAAGRFVAARLHDAGVVHRIVVEERPAALSFYVRKLRRVGVVNFAFQAALNRWFRAETARHLPAVAMPVHERLPDVNAMPLAPNELVIGFGTSYIRQATLARAPHGVLNLHTGWLPDYRGVKSEFWALRHGDVRKLGWTVHFMSPELDGGDIVLQRCVEHEGENPGELRAKLLRDAMDPLSELLQRIAALGMRSVQRVAQPPGRYFSTPTLADWRAYRRATRVEPMTARRST